jgi:hypothetical protein
MSKNSRDGKTARRHGCLITVAVVLVLGATVIFFAGAPIRKAKQREQSLNDSFGWAETYTPAANGSIPPERVEAFLRIREAVIGHCSGFREILEEITEVDEIENDKEIHAGERASKSIRSLGRMLTLVQKYLAIVETRNEALLSEQMGLGEYIYIYLTAYSEQLAHEADSRFYRMKEAYVSDRTLDEFVSILENQVEAAENLKPGAVSANDLSEIRAEIKALGNGSQHSPWPDGPPAASKSSLAPYRDQLVDLYCPGIVKVELLQKNRGFQFEG